MAAVRIGFDDNRTLGEKETGGRTALPIFREIMLRVYQDKLVGPAPHFPCEIEEGIDRCLATQASMELGCDTLPLRAWTTASSPSQWRPRARSSSLPHTRARSQTLAIFHKLSVRCCL